jgi:hypothetical protein
LGSRPHLSSSFSPHSKRNFVLIALVLLDYYVFRYKAIVKLGQIFQVISN